MTRRSIREYLAAQRGRYERASRAERHALLGAGLVAVTGYHRKALIRHLRQRRPPRPGVRPVGAPASTVRPWPPRRPSCGRPLGRLAPNGCSPSSPPCSRGSPPVARCGFGPSLAAQLRQASVSTLERLLAPARRTTPRRGPSLTRPGAWLKAQIPQSERLPVGTTHSPASWRRISSRTADKPPGVLPAHAVRGEHRHRLGRAPAGLRAKASTASPPRCTIRRRLPVPVWGLDTDNGSEFINRPLFYCGREGITFTRSRAYRKNDSAHVEQKNGALVRALVGYDRYTSRAAYARAPPGLPSLRLHSNFFQPVQRLLAKQRHSTRAPRLRSRPNAVSAPRRPRGAGARPHAALERQYEALNPLQLRRQIDAALASLWRLATRDPPPRRRSSGSVSRRPGNPDL